MRTGVNRMPLRELIEMFDKRKGKIAGIVAEPVGYLPPGYEHMSGPDGPSPLGTPEGDLHFQPSRDPAAAAAEAVKAAGLGGGSNSGSAWNPEERNGGGRGGGRGGDSGYGRGGMGGGMGGGVPVSRARPPPQGEFANPAATATAGGGGMPGHGGPEPRAISSALQTAPSAPWSAGGGPPGSGGSGNEVWPFFFFLVWFVCSALVACSFLWSVNG